MSQARIAVIVPAFNVAPYVEITLESLLRQTHTNWVAHVVDDGSTDTTASVIAGFTDPRIRLYRQPNCGLPAARNHALDAAWSDPVGCDAILMLDSDDWLDPTALARLLAGLLADPGTVASYGPYATMKMTDRPGDPPRGIGHGPRRGGDVLPILLAYNPFRVGMVMVRAQVARAVGPFAPLRLGEDWDYWIRLALLGPFARVAAPEPLFFYRRREAGLYRSQVDAPARHSETLRTIFENPALRARLGPDRLARARTLAERQVLRTLARGAATRGDTKAARRFLSQAMVLAPSFSDFRRLLGLWLSPLALRCLRRGRKRSVA